MEHPALQPEDLGVMDALAVRTALLDRVQTCVDQRHCGVEIPFARHRVGKNGATVRNINAMSGFLQPFDRSIELTDAVRGTTGPEPGDPLDDLRHDLRHQRYTTLPANAFR